MYNIDYNQSLLICLLTLLVLFLIKKKQPKVLKVTETVLSINELPRTYYPKLYEICLNAKNNNQHLKITINKIITKDITQVYIMPEEYCNPIDNDGTFIDPSLFLQEIKEIQDG